MILSILIRGPILGLILVVMALVPGTVVAEQRVTTPTELGAALKAPETGQILLAPGDYGKLKIRGTYPQGLVLRADPPREARFDTIEISGAVNVTLDGLRIGGMKTAGKYLQVIDSSRNITIRNSEIGGPPGSYKGFGIRAANGAQLVYENNYVHHVTNGIANFQNSDIVLKGNVVDHVAGDSYKFGGVNGGLVENNIGAAHVSAREGAHNDFMQFQGTPSRNIVIRGNAVLPAEGADASHQGIFVNTKGDVENFLVEQNIIIGALLRGISIEDGKNVTIRYNTLLDVPGQAVNSTRIFANSNAVIENNIWTEETGRADGSNVVVQHVSPYRAYYVYDLFRDFRGTGTTLEGLIPVAGKAAEGRGAHRRLMQMLGG
ncbi:right-handed parallel beta-helix repeat-containing protein [Halovulum sp. GXIMD14794]